jgi:alpha-L-fucosidase 2
MPRPLRSLLWFLSLLPLAAAASAADVPTLDDANVTWDTPSENAMASMPLGNGDIALNVWVEKSTGDLLFYIAKTDAWGDNVRSDFGLPKVGRVRISLDGQPPEHTHPFRQSLRLAQGQITIDVNGNSYLIWVDANNPVIHAESTSPQPVAIRVAFESDRLKPEHGLQADTIFPDQKNRVAWCYRNKSKEAPQLVNLTFGGLIEGPNLASAGDNLTLAAPAAKTHRVDIHVLTSQPPTAETFLSQLEALGQKTDATDLETARKNHLAWWTQFWSRSSILLGGTPDATQAFTGYTQQRFISACMGRGAYPIKFNGGLFTVDMKFRRDNKDKVYPADQRDWGGQYWFQNTRPMYWPMLASGDFDMMLPLFKMYKGEIEYNEPLVKKYYNHEGSYFAETAPFWGHIDNITSESPPSWTNRYYTPVLELTMMMLDYAEYTGDAQIVKDTIVPVAKLGLTFFDKHFPRDAKGKLLLDPDNSIEQFWKIRNPTPDIAGLHAILPRLLALPEDAVDAATRKDWQRLLSELPVVPTGTRNGKKAILPMEEGPEQNKNPQPRNSENPELYTIYPFRLYGLTKPDLDVARHTFDIRKQKNKGCWVQDPIQAAMLGLTDTAVQCTLFDLTRKDPNLRFPAFWDHGNDYMPDLDNGGNGLNGLQQMLLYADGKKIVLLPAWPKDWTASFKLHAPFQTTIEATVRNGKIENLKVTPAERAKDVTISDSN